MGKESVKRVDNLPFFEAINRAEASRDKEWDPLGKIDLPFVTIEFAGEAGELANKVKKVIRRQKGIKGSRTNRHELQQEIGDVLICLIRVCRRLGIDPGDSVLQAFNEKSIELGFATVLHYFPDGSWGVTTPTK